MGKPKPKRQRKRLASRQDRRRSSKTSRKPSRKLSRKRKKPKPISQASPLPTLPVRIHLVGLIHLLTTAQNTRAASGVTEAPFPKVHTGVMALRQIAVTAAKTKGSTR